MKAFYDCPIRLYIYGTAVPFRRAQLEERLKKDKLVKATQLKQTRKENEEQRKAMGLKSGRATAGLPSGGEEEVSLEQLAQTSQAVNFRAAGDIAQTLAMDEHQLSQLPEAKQPEKVSAKLLPYQLQGLAWLTARETPTYPDPASPESVQLWKRDARGRYVNIATNFSTASPPGLLSGGVSVILEPLSLLWAVSGVEQLLRISRLRSRIPKEDKTDPNCSRCWPMTWVWARHFRLSPWS